MVVNAWVAALLFINRERDAFHVGNRGRFLTLQHTARFDAWLVTTDGSLEETLAAGHHQDWVVDAVEQFEVLWATNMTNLTFVDLVRNESTGTVKLFLQSH